MQATTRAIGRGVLRGTALFLGGFSLINSYVSRAGSARLENIWWIDLSFIASPFGTIFSVVLALALLAFAFKPHMGAARRALSIIVFSLAAAAAGINCLSYYQGLQQHAFTSTVPVPFTLVVFFLFIALVISAVRWHNERGTVPEFSIMVLMFLLGFVLFPLAQIETFGHTDYRAKAEVAVVFGARAYPSGVPSQTLRYRLDTAIDLYESGYVPLLYLSGGIDSDGVDETRAMQAYVVAHGVPAKACLRDNGGQDTDASVADTTATFEKRGITSVLAVSSFYHLPRIKMAYRAKRFNVRTVPAVRPAPIAGEWFTVLREVPAFWVYWLRAAVRDVAPLRALAARLPH